MRIAATLSGFALMVCAVAHAETVTVPLKHAVVEHDKDAGQDLVNVVLAPEGQRRITTFTRDRVGRKIYLRLDGTLLTAPTLMSPIEGNTLQLSPGLTGFGNLSAQAIVTRLNERGAVEVSDEK
ncbi:hypothetical protein [uncultured Oxalicibacterium sp.]|uniref:SecDF P1 head subdomain-containing protein n=1 Tax=uncultured Oxalicibacterium sp. TaxID=1168540 RepID=UPI0025F13EFF|nr:hypothetical protein [uncultured Oxalicibacterium sp.]